MSVRQSACSFMFLVQLSLFVQMSVLPVMLLKPNTRIFRVTIFTLAKSI